MKDALKRICELQPKYAAENTPQMHERGIALRDVVKPGIEGLRPALATALGRFGEDFLVEASDGIGRKTELPWVRFCSKSMSPNPTEGFYSVVHFSTDGTAVHITVGCGSSRFKNGSTVPLPDTELDAQTSWARSVILEAVGTLEPFTDVADFGARRKLPISFQRATALCKRVGYQEIEQTDIEGLLIRAAGALKIIYEAQAKGRDLTPADQLELEISSILRPARRQYSRQGYNLPPAAKRAVELRAMAVSEQLLKSSGYTVRDTSTNNPFDYEAQKDGLLFKVEVKGTTSDAADAILMTKNEVELHRRDRGRTALLIVTKIRLIEKDGAFTAEGGDAEFLLGWDIDGWSLEPTAFRLTRR